MALFTGTFVGIVTLFIEYVIPEGSFASRIIIIALAAVMGGLIGSKLFPSKNEEEKKKSRLDSDLDK